MAASRKKQVEVVTHPDEAYQAYVENLVRFCMQWVNHTEYRYFIKFSDEQQLEQGKSAATYAQITVNHVYLYMNLTVFHDFKSQYSDGDYASCGADILHEICHLFMAPVQDLLMWDASASQVQHFTETIERQTQRIRNSILDGMPDDWYMPDRIAELVKGR
jgi:hypothetical protein